jgi:hypothetical protein
MIEAALVHIPPEPAHLPVYGLNDELRRAVLNGVAEENSKRNYALALDELTAFCREKQQPISRTLILEFRAAMLDRNLGASTINVKLSTYRVTRELPAPLQDDLPSIEDLRGVVEKLRGELEAAREGKPEQADEEVS